MYNGGLSHKAIFGYTCTTLVPKGLMAIQIGDRHMSEDRFLHNAIVSLHENHTIVKYKYSRILICIEPHTSS